MSRKESAKIVGKNRWINTATGEVRETVEVEKYVGRDEHFMIAYLSEIINMIDTLGNKKMQIVKYNLQNMCKANNTLFCTIRELAEKTGTSTRTVTETLKALEETKIIERRTGGLMVNPHLMNNWNRHKEAYMMVTYKEFAEAGEENNNAGDQGTQNNAD